MITLSNKQLTVELIDPVADRARTGSRYCNGCYIWQVYDGLGRALLSGPEYPDSDPPAFDGQGLPEAFAAPLGGDCCAVGENVCVIGVGLVKKSSGIEPFHPRDNPDVILPCEWDIDINGGRVVMTTAQSFKDKSIHLRREVNITGSRVESVTTVGNTGPCDIGLRWFAHPFFPLNENLTCGKITPEVSLPESAGYEIDGGGIIRMKRDYKWSKGLFQVLDIPNKKLNFAIPHPVAGTVDMRTDYDVVRCPIWANSNTFSFEPFIERVVKAGGIASWKITYGF